MQAVDTVQATGLGLYGPLQSLSGTRSVTNTAVPLDQANVALPVQAGQLYISVTNSGTGTRTLNSVAIDPSTQSLQDVAAAITAATSDQVQATVNSQTNTLQLQATAGYAFDFAGQLPTTPDVVNMGGTSTPSVTGTWNGSANDSYSFQILGSGTVGVTPGLQMAVHDGSGALVATLDIGSNYTPGTALALPNGISVSLSAGTTTNGSFSARLIAEPDTSGILAGLGVNSLFSGNNAISMAVRPELLADPGLLSASRNGDAGDGQNLERLAAVQDQATMTGGTQTFAQFVSSYMGAIGTEVNSLQTQQQAQQTLQQSLRQQQQSVSGVDVNEEMVRLLEFQRLIDSGARYLSVVNTSLNEIVNLIPVTSNVA
jgi:flagellar hook-associated protein FlgK